MHSWVSHSSNKFDDVRCKNKVRNIIFKCDKIAYIIENIFLLYEEYQKVSKNENCK